MSDGLPPLREVMARYGLGARKSLGQNFLLDLNLTGRIARAAGVGRDSVVYEVGPGPGGLTRALLAAGAKQVIAVEKDRRCIAALEEVAAAYPSRLTIIEADATEIDEATLPFAAGRRQVVANLPYNIGNQLLVKWLCIEPWPSLFESFTLMFQKEVGRRLVAQSGGKAYGRLSVLSQWRCDVSRLFDVQPQAFVPPPKVTSSVMHLHAKAPQYPCTRPALEKVTAAAFGQRRKMLRASLKSLNVDVARLLNTAGLAPAARAEEVDVAGFCRLANALEA